MEKREQIDLENMVTAILFEIGVPAHIKGFHYLKEAIIIAVGNMDAINDNTRAVYSRVAKTFRTTSDRVDRAIHHAIEIAWDRGDLDTLLRFFGYTVSNIKGKPTNSEFIALVADKLRLQLRAEENKSAEQQESDADDDTLPTVEAVVVTTLFQFGFPANIRGYRYLKKAIMIALEDREAVCSVAREIYTPVAKQYATTPEKVEGAIRTAIEIAWDRGDLDTLQQYFGYTVSEWRGKPTNSEFIALVADKLYLQLRDGKHKAVKQHRSAKGNAAVVSQVLSELSVPQRLKGYPYLKKAILLAIADENAIYEMTNRIYAPVAAAFGTTPDLASQAMVRAVLVSWDLCDLDVLQTYFGYTISNTRGYPTISEFIALVAERIRLGISPLDRKA